MSNEPGEDELFQRIVASYSSATSMHEKLAQINIEREEIHKSIDHYSQYLKAFLPFHAERSLAHGYLLYLSGKLRDLNQREDTLLWEFFKSSNDAAQEQLGEHRSSSL